VAVFHPRFYLSLAHLFILSLRKKGLPSCTCTHLDAIVVVNLFRFVRVISRCIHRDAGWGTGDWLRSAPVVSARAQRWCVANCSALT